MIRHSVSMNAARPPAWDAELEQDFAAAAASVVGEDAVAIVALKDILHPLPTRPSGRRLVFDLHGRAEGRAETRCTTLSVVSAGASRDPEAPLTISMLVTGVGIHLLS